MKIKFLTVFLVITLFVTLATGVFENEEDLALFLREEYETNASAICNKYMLASWDYNTDISNAEKSAALTAVTLERAQIQKYYWENYFRNLSADDYTDESIKRQVNSLILLGTAALDSEKLTQLSNSTTTMQNIYSTAKICPYTNQDCDLTTEGLSLDPDIEEVLSTSTDYDELLYVWDAWRSASGAKMKDIYPTYVSLSNEAALANGYSDMGAYWRRSFETDDFVDQMDRLWRQVKPLYFELHRYVGKKLKERYGDVLDISDGLIPAHVFGNMWAQDWSSLSSLVRPYPNASETNVTGALVSQGYTPTRMFETADEFYTSMNLSNMTMAYGPKAMIEKPSDRDVLCHASAWDMCDGSDFRIKMCTSINSKDFITIHHELGHIQYYIQYKDLPRSLRGGANPGFHEAIGDLIALSAETPKHLEKVGLLENYVESNESSINALMDMALSKIAFLPFGLLIDKWRWDVFNGSVTSDKYNSQWWYYREKYQKVKAPNARSDQAHFDPGAKYHVAGNSQYISYFIAHILQFQLYKSLCIAAGEYDPNNTSDKPLHNCDFYQSSAAGNLLASGLKLGSSRHWSEALSTMTNETDLSASALMEYFEPLYTFLKNYNGPMTETELQNFLEKDYEEDASIVSNKQVIAEWNYATDIDNANASAKQTEATLESAEFEKLYWQYYFKDLNASDYTNETLKRAVKDLVVLGTAALDTQKLTELTTVLNTMSNIYSTGKICPFDNQYCDLTTAGLSLDPDLETILRNSTDYDELSYVWKSWRDATGAKMKDYYKTYVNLSNEAAQANGFKNMGEMWIQKFESDTFINDMDTLWDQVRPLYDELHKYVGNKLKERFGDKLDISDGLIPAHIFGNMWAQDWTALKDLVVPYPDAQAADVTTSMQNQNYTVLKMFQTADNFYQSLGLEPNTMSYGSKAMIEKPADREVLCHASAWDFSDGEDFRIKMCTSINYNDFVTVHHEMGHIEYFILYKDQPVNFRTGANPGVHEAVGDLIALSVSTPKHLQKIGLLDNYQQSEQAALNTLMNMALEKIAFLPFGLLVDKWRWDVFNGTVGPDDWNSRWWYYRENIQKVKAPVERTSSDFDPGAKYHVPGDSQYISYFVAFILQFQLYRSLCKTAGQYDPDDSSLPLYNCDFYENTDVGSKLRAGLSLGASKHWKEALQVITGENDYDGTAIIEYFEPLYNWLKQQNSATETPPSVTSTQSPVVTTTAAPGDNGAPSNWGITQLFITMLLLLISM